MKKISLHVLIIVQMIAICFSEISANELKWRLLPNSPVETSRFNDCYFINANTGWVCSANQMGVFKTTDSGESWFVVGFTQSGVRAITFFDSLIGIAGEFSSANAIYRTTDGGLTWPRRFLPAPSGTGICGLSRVNDSVLYGCGRYGGSSRVIKTTDKGQTWQNIDMNKYSRYLVDLIFFNADTGFVFGSMLSGSVSYGLVLRTMDGGTSWDTVGIAPAEQSHWCWKVSFPNRNTGFASLEPAFSSRPARFLKTTNGGSDWQMDTIISSGFVIQGLGFVNEQYGWAGGWSNVSYETTNGGDDWQILEPSNPSIFSNINRFRFLGDTLGFAVGKRVYRYSKEIPTNISENNLIKSREFYLYQNFPNPFNPSTKVKFTLETGMILRVDIFDALGRIVDTVIQADYLPAGTHEFEWNASGLPSGTYYCRVQGLESELSINMLLIK